MPSSRRSSWSREHHLQRSREEGQQVPSVWKLGVKWGRGRDGTEGQQGPMWGATSWAETVSDNLPVRVLEVRMMNLVFIVRSRKASAAWVSVGFRQVQACLTGMPCWLVRSQSVRNPLGGTSPHRREPGPSSWPREKPCLFWGGWVWGQWGKGIASWLSPLWLRSTSSGLPESQVGEQKAGSENGKSCLTEAGLTNSWPVGWIPPEQHFETCKNLAFWFSFRNSPKPGKTGCQFPQGMIAEAKQRLPSLDEVWALVCHSPHHSLLPHMWLSSVLLIYLTCPVWGLVFSSKTFVRHWVLLEQDSFDYISSQPVQFWHFEGVGAQCRCLVPICFVESFPFVSGLKDSLTKETTRHTQPFQYLLEDSLT